MKKYIFIYLMFLLTACGGSDNANHQPEYVGLWRFPYTAVWVDISESGDVFQCRIAADEVVIASRGTIDGDTILWDEIWGIDQVKVVEGELLLDGIYGEFSYISDGLEMHVSCINELTRLNDSDLILGDWQHIYANTGCREVQNFYPDGSWSLISLNEEMHGTYELYRGDEEEGRTIIVFSIMEDNGGTDCNGDIDNYAGSRVASYIGFSGDSILGFYLDDVSILYSRL